jgi:lactonase
MPNTHPKNEWGTLPKRPLPPGIADLPTIEAKIKYRIADGTERPGCEGPIFDRHGNFYICHTKPDATDIKRITPEGEISDFFSYRKGMIVGLGIHKDGRIFGADLRSSGFVVLSADGKQIDFLDVRRADGSSMMCDDLAFDRQGNLWFTDFEGDYLSPKGGVYRLSADSGYKTMTEILTDSPGTMNGISFSPEYDMIWIADTSGQRVLRILLDPDGMPVRRAFGIFSVSPPFGAYHPDSNKVDADGNLYQAMMHGGWVLVYNRYGIPIANVVAPGREDGKLLNTPNLAICPGAKEAYLCASDSDDVVVLSSPTLAAGPILYSHM